MKKGSFSKLFVLLLVVGLLFAAGSTMQAKAATTVTTEAELREELDAGATEIELGANFSLSSTVYINHSVIINGKGYAITGPSGDHGVVVMADGVTIKNLQITGSGKTNLQFYLAKGGVVENVILDFAGNAGMIVNGSEVTISGVITKGNVWGGINVDQGTGVTQEPHLTVLDVGYHTSLEEANPTAAIWVDTGKAAWVTAPVGYAIVPGTPLRFFDNPEFNYLKLYNSYPVHNVTQNSYFTEIQPAVTAANAGDVIELAAGDYNVTAVINLDKAITLTGPTTGEAKVIGAGGVNLSIFNIASNNVTIQNLTLTLASTPKSHTALITSPDAYHSNIDILNNKFYVEPQAGGMGAWFGQAIYLGRNHSATKINGNTVYNLRGGIIAYYNNELEIKDNLIYNTKGGIMNYTGSAANAAARIISGNSWSTVHNEWDIVWNSGGGPYEMDMDLFVLQMSNNNNGAWVTSQMTTGTPAELKGNRSHVFVDVSTGTETIKADNGNINVPYKNIQDGIDAVVSGGTVYVAAGTYQEEITVTGKSFDLIGKTDGEGVPIVVLNGWLSISNSDPFTSFEIKDIYFKGTNSHLLKLSNVDGRLDIDNCVFDGMGRFMTEPHINGINLNTTIEVYVTNSVFKEGLYVGINGYNAGWIEVYDSEFINIKSGINLQSNSHSVQIDRNYFKIKPVSETDSYGVRFGSETGNANGLWMRRNTIEVDRTGGYTPSAGNYHAAIIIRAGVDPDAGPGNIYFTDNVINDELVTFYKVEYLDTYFAANTWPEGYGVLGNKITLIKPPQMIYLPLIFK